MDTAIATTPHAANNLTHESDHCRFQSSIDGLRKALNQSLRGKDDVVEFVLVCLLARGHLLIEDLPGLGKTTLAKALAHAVGGHFARVQCTPDMFNQKTREFEFTQGPVFADVLLADEINRATPRTQSSLFEAMAERQVTIDKECHHLPATFFVIATQNPVESHGAYPLPEAQLDRFAMKLGIGYPDRSSELQMLADNVGGDRQDAVPQAAVVTPDQLRHLQNHVTAVHVGEKVQNYLVDLAEATREHRDVLLGLSPRGLLTWQRLAQAEAHLRGRDFVTPDDVQRVAEPVLSVRLTGEFESPQPIIDDIVGQVSVPVLDGK